MQQDASVTSPFDSSLRRRIISLKVDRAELTKRRVNVSRQVNGAKNVKNGIGYLQPRSAGYLRMIKDQVSGLAILVLSVLGIILYAWFVYDWPLITLQITAFLTVALILAIAAWIGYTMATTPLLTPLEPTLTSAAPTPTSITSDTEK